METFPLFPSRTRQICSSLLCLILMAGCNAPRRPTSQTMNEYSQRVKYKEYQDLAFPDFILRYMGQTKVTPPQYPRGFINYNFVVKVDGNEQKISWSSGTGLIAPLSFSVGGKSFWLELQAADKFGALAPDELVISPSPATP